MNQKTSSYGIPHGKRLLEPYFKGDRDEFFNMFRDYLQRISLLCEMVTSLTPYDQAGQAAFLRPILHTFQNAVEVMQTGDSALLADLIRCKSKDMEDMANLLIKVCKEASS